MARGIYEGQWMKKILEELHVMMKFPIKLYCDNKEAISIYQCNLALSNQAHRGKHNFHQSKCGKMDYLHDIYSTQKQVVDIFTVGLP